MLEYYPQFQSGLAHRIPAVTLALLSMPARSSDGRHVEWYSELAGQPVPLAQVVGDARARAEVLLRDRLDALRSQADTLTAEGQTALADALRLAAAPPQPDMIYVVNGQPVLTNWDRPRGGVAAPPVQQTVAAPIAAAGGRPWWRWLLGLLAILALLLLLGWLLRSCDTLPRLDGLGNTAAPNDEEAALREEAARLEQELRDRLAACQTPSAPPPPAAASEAPMPTGTPNAGQTGLPQPAVTPPPAADKRASPPKPPQTADGKAEKPAKCPKPMAKWEAPEVVVLLDGSGSMALPTNISEAEINSLANRARAGDAAALQRLRGLRSGGPGSRIAAAKQAVNSVTQSLPPEIDLGLVVFGECKGADNYKFFSAAERPRLSQLLADVTPREGTPLARGLERAGNMVDGTTVPAVIVVVSDGEDSCQGDPCAVARKLKAGKPKLKINVIDVDGSGAGRCMAEATGGKVLKTGAGMSWKDLIQEATDQPARPPGCG